MSFWSAFGRLFEGQEAAIRRAKAEAAAHFERIARELGFQYANDDYGPRVDGVFDGLTFRYYMWSLTYGYDAMPTIYFDWRAAVDVAFHGAGSPEALELHRRFGEPKPDEIVPGGDLARAPVLPTGDARIDATVQTRATDAAGARVFLIESRRAALAANLDVFNELFVTRDGPLICVLRSAERERFRYYTSDEIRRALRFLAAFTAG